MKRRPLTDEEIADAADRAEGKKPEPEAKRGRPAKYQASFASEAAAKCALGATNAELADFFGVAISTVKLWAVQHEEFSAALKVGKEYADQQVERSLYQRAVGYTFDSEKVMAVKGEVVRVPTREHIAPDVTAQIFWLKNRQPERWRDRHELTGKDGGPIDVKLGVSGLLAAVKKSADRSDDTE